MFALQTLLKRNWQKGTEREREKGGEQVNCPVFRQYFLIEIYHTAAPY